jgi:hypothetical protein
MKLVMICYSETRDIITENTELVSVIYDVTLRNTIVLNF